MDDNPAVAGPRPPRTHRVTIAIAAGPPIFVFETAEGVSQAVLDPRIFAQMTPASPLTIKVETL